MFLIRQQYPPYLTWETAADLIMSAINISSFGDTIYVANGVYEEQVVMIPGLSLIGAGMDSCVIDTRTLVNATDFASVVVADSCLLRGFCIMVGNDNSLGCGASLNGTCLLTKNKITNARIGVFSESTGQGSPLFYLNLLTNIGLAGVYAFNSNIIIRGNYFNMGTNGDCGINLGAYDFTYHPVIDSNYFGGTFSEGIKITFGTKTTISNNIINGDTFGYGFLGSYSDTVKIFNNLIMSSLFT